MLEASKTDPFLLCLVQPRQLGQLHLRREPGCYDQGSAGHHRDQRREQEGLRRRGFRQGLGDGGGRALCQHALER